MENGEGDLVQQKPCLVSAEPCHHTHTHKHHGNRNQDSPSIYGNLWKEHGTSLQCGVFSAGSLESSFQAFRRFDKDGSGMTSICSKHRKRYSMAVLGGFLEAAECRHMCAYLGPGAVDSTGGVLDGSEELAWISFSC